MPVFFIHDPAQGIVTPLDRRFRVRDIPPTSELTETNAIHPKQGGEEQAGKRSLGQKNREAKHAYAQNLQLGSFKLGKVRDVMSTPVIAVFQEQRLSDAWQLMQRHDIRHLAIVNSEQQLCGMLSEKILLPDMMAHELTSESVRESNPPLAHYCRQQVLSTSPETDLVDLAEAMLEQGLDGMPVTQGGKLVGIVTDSDVLKVILKSRPLDVQI